MTMERIIGTDVDHGPAYEVETEVVEITFSTPKGVERLSPNLNERGQRRLRREIGNSLWFQFLDQVEVPEESGAQMSRAIQCGDFSVLDDLRHSQERGLEPSVFEDEEWLELRRRFIQVLVQKKRTVPSVRSWIQAAITWGKDEGIREARNVDYDRRPKYDEQVVETWNDTREDRKILNYVEHFAEKLSPRMLFKVRDRIFTLRKDGKLAYDIYVKATLLVLEQIVLRCNSDQKLLERFQEMLWQLQSVQNESVREVSAGTASLGENALIEAIDIRAAARRISQRHNVSFEDACLMFHPECEDADVATIFDCEEEDEEVEVWAEWEEVE